jgi:hypothetical protein
MTAKTVQNPSSTTYTPAIGAIGSPNSYLISGGGGGGGNGGAGYLTNTGAIGWSNPTFNSQLHISPSGGGDAIIKTNHHEINLDKLYKTVMMLSEKFMIIADDPYFTEKYPTLKDAYEQYQTLLELYKIEE